MTKKEFSLLLILLLCGSVYGQSYNEDEIHHEKALFYLKRNKDSLLFYAKKLQQSNDHCRVLFGMYYESNVLYNQGKYSLCEKKLNEILSLTKNHKNTNNYQYSDKLIGKTYNECINIAKLNVYRRFFYIKRNQGDYSKAYEYLTLNKKIVDNLPIKDTYYFRKKISVEKKMAQLKYSIGDYEASLKILLDTNKQIKNIKLDTTNIWLDQFLLEESDINALIGVNYKKLAKESNHFIDSTELYYEKAYQLTQQIDDTLKLHKGIHYIRKSTLDYFRGQYNTALKHADTASTFYINKNIPIVHQIKLQSFAKLKLVDSVFKYSNSALKLIKGKGGYNRHKGETYKYLSESYFEINQLDSAYKYSQKYIKIKLADNKNKSATGRILKNSEIAEILDLNKSIEKKREQAQNKLVFTYFLSLLTICGIIFFFVKKRKKNLKKTKNKTHNIDETLEDEILKKLKEIEESDFFLNQDFNLLELSKLLNTNTSYLSKIINEHKQKTFRQYLIELRINRLMENLDKNPLLRKYSILALAESVGYKNASSFRRMFKNYMNETPAQYISNKYKNQPT